MDVTKPYEFIGFVVQPALFFEPAPVPRLPGPAAGLREPKIGQGPGAFLGPHEGLIGSYKLY